MMRIKTLHPWLNSQFYQNGRNYLKQKQIQNVQFLNFYGLGNKIWSRENYINEKEGNNKITIKRPFFPFTWSWCYFINV